ncbi:ribosomal protein S3 (apicoplast) [Babesia ovis]|uniref:Ribosomal protein S3 n=1 Tax=Babesia ovis TaxID=5869 RepID=A0A9W5TDU8_BABOV|nr:ribosomal protein S3 [Babesia ovis]
MTKSISPIIFRSNLFLNSINKIHIKINKNLTYLNHFKFFQVLLNTIYMYKKTLKKIQINTKFLYFTCSYIDIYNICLNICFYDISRNTKDLIKSYKFMYVFNRSLNYFMSYKIHKNKSLFIWTVISYVKNKINNKFYILHNIKYYLLKSSNSYYKIISFCSKILNMNIKNKCDILGIKIKYSGCLQKGGNKKKVFSYTKGDVPICTISKNVDYISGHINTYKGAIGIKCWMVFK